MAMRHIAAVAVFVHVLFATVHAVKQKTNMRKSDPDDFREVFNPPTVLILSSPMERKVSYTQIKNFKSVGGVVMPLIDAGLIAPAGLAWDKKRGALYIADSALRKIFRVKLKAFKCTQMCKGMQYQLKVVGNRYTVIEGVISQWVALDSEGSLFFTNQEANSVNKLPKKTIDLIIKDKLSPKDLLVTTEAELEGDEAAAEGLGPIDDENAAKVKVEPQPVPQNQIHQLYVTKACDHVGTPAGLASEGTKLYWTNQVGGFAKGAVAEGSTKPKVMKPAEGDSAPTFPSIMVANNTGAAYGVALTTSKILYTDTAHKVWAASRGNGEVVALTSSMLKPRGIVWDGDNTAYISDEEGNTINSIPIGLLKTGAPVSHAVDVHSPFGLVMLNKNDPIWDQFKDSGANQVKLACVALIMMLMHAM